MIKYDSFIETCHFHKLSVIVEMEVHQSLVHLEGFLAAR